MYSFFSQNIKNTFYIVVLEFKPEYIEGWQFLNSKKFKNHSTLMYCTVYLMMREARNMLFGKSQSMFLGNQI